MRALIRLVLVAALALATVAAVTACNPFAPGQVKKTATKTK